MVNDLAADRARIAEIERLIFELRAEQATVQERLDSYKYPVLTLPNEITSEIFINFVPSYPICPPLVGILSPTSLTRICRKWRAIALATPALWRAIGLSASHVPSTVQGYVPQIFVNAWLSRSGSCPLSIHMDELMNPAVANLISSILPHRARWEHLKLRLCDEAPLHLSEGSMPLLRHLDLACDEPTALAFNDVPQLRTVVLVDAVSSSVTLPWVQLTSLDLFWAEPSAGIRILQQAANLAHCTLLFSTNDDISNHPNHPPFKITLPSLESLVLRNPRTRTTGETARRFLAALVAPALLRLEIPEAFLERNPVDSLASFISTSNCKRIREINITERTLRMSRGVYEATYRAIFPSIQFSFEYDDDSSDEESD